MGGAPALPGPTRHNTTWGQISVLSAGTERTTGASCPSWCVNTGIERAGHAHVSADLIGGSPEQPLVARLIGMEHDQHVRVLLNDRVTSIDELDQFVSGLRRLVDGVRLAEPGLGFVATLAARADVTLEDLARAANVPVHRVAAQDEGQQVLTVNEYDRLALAAANLVSAARTVA